MRVLVAGASGVIGQPLVKLLIAAGHSVIGTSRSPIKAAALRSRGVTPLVIDVYGAQALGDAVAAVRPEVVVHLITDLPDRIDPDGMAEMSARNARVRIEGTRNLVAAAVRAGARRLVAQSIAWAYVPGREPHVEEDPLDVEAEGNRGVTVRGVAELERLVGSVPRLETLILRYGQLYGSGTWNAGPAGRVPLHVDAAPAPRRWPSSVVGRAPTTSPRTGPRRPTRRRAASSARTRPDASRSTRARTARS